MTIYYWVLFALVVGLNLAAAVLQLMAGFWPMSVLHVVIVGVVAHQFLKLWKAMRG